MKEYLKKLTPRRVAVMTLGLLVMSVGVMLFRLSLTGNDPGNGLNMALAHRLGIGIEKYGYIQWTTNILFFAVEFIWGRKYIGLGTFANWLLIGPVSGFLIGLAQPLMPAQSPLWLSAVLMASGVLVLSLSVSLYQTPDVGVSPYDSMALVLSDHTPIPYFWCRVMVDSSISLCMFLLSGTEHLGLGTVCCALGLGPFITFFNRTVSEKLCGMKGPGCD